MTQEKIVSMFDNIAYKYDFVNRVLSMGIDKQWRKEAIRSCCELIDKNEIKIADIACGTGDMIEIWNKEILIHQKTAQIIGIDPSAGMLDVAKKRFSNIDFFQAYATNLPLENESIDVISISFGIRNVLDIKKAIKEFHRVLMPQGNVIILEFTKENKPSLFRQLLDFYTNKILPKIGGYLSNNKEAYEYLPNSINNFYTADELINLFEGFELKKLKKFNFGQVSLIILQKK